MPEDKEIGRRIRECREKRGYTLDDIGRALDMNRSTISRYEKGYTERIKLPVIQRLAEVLDTTPSYLIYGYTRDPAGDRPEPTDRGDRGMEDALHTPILYYHGKKNRPDGPDTMDSRLPVYGQNELKSEKIRQSVSSDEFVMRVESREMSPRIEAGDFVTVRRCGAAVDGKIALLAGSAGQIIMRRVNLCDCGYFLTTLHGEPEYVRRDEFGVQYNVIGVITQLQAGL